MRAAEGQHDKLVELHLQVEQHFRRRHVESVRQAPPVEVRPDADALARIEGREGDEGDRPVGGKIIEAPCREAAVGGDHEEERRRRPDRRRENDQQRRLAEPAEPVVDDDHRFDGTPQQGLRHHHRREGADCHGRAEEQQVHDRRAGGERGKRKQGEHQEAAGEQPDQARLDGGDAVEGGNEAESEDARQHHAGGRGGREHAEIGERQRVGEQHEIGERKDQTSAGAADRREIVAHQVAAPGKQHAHSRKRGRLDQVGGTGHDAHASGQFLSRRSASGRLLR